VAPAFVLSRDPAGQSINIHESQLKVEAKAAVQVVFRYNISQNLLLQNQVS
jgi:hypothetical protein